MDDLIVGALPARPWSVAALLLALADVLGQRFAAAVVRGEISGYTRAASGHCYFTLKDADGQPAVLRCAMFRRAASLLDFVPGDGQQVELRGRIALYEPRGELQCVVEALSRLGAGSLYELFLRLRERLAAAGLFDAARKRALPRCPRAIGVVTSAAAAAWHDVVSALRRRAPQVRIVLYPCLVQGAEAPAQIVGALQTAAERAEVDTLIVCRGGGSLEDLWAFNDEAVVRAVAASPIPVVCGVGHEIDVTLAELAADLRAPTPTAAAELASPRRDDELKRLAMLHAQLQRALRRRLDAQAQRLDRAAWQLARPAGLLARRSAALDRLGARLVGAAVQRLAREQVLLAAQARALPRAARRSLALVAEALARCELRLRAGDPRQVLARGYVFISDATGTPVTRAAQVAAGERLRAQWADGAADLRVERRVRS